MKGCVRAMKMKGRQRCAGARSIDGGRAPHLAASDGQRVRVRHGILAHVELGHVHLQEGGGLLEEGVDLRKLILGHANGRADVLEQRDLLGDGAEHRAHDVLDAGKQRQELRVLAIERVPEVVAPQVRDVPDDATGRRRAVPLGGRSSTGILERVVVGAGRAVGGGLGDLAYLSTRGAGRRRRPSRS